MHKLTENGKKALRRIAKYLAKNPNRFNMLHVFNNPNLSGILTPSLFKYFFKTECGITMCLAGGVAFQNLPNLSTLNEPAEVIAWAMNFLSGGYDRDLDYFFVATDLNSSNVQQTVEAFIEEGIEGVQRLLQDEIDLSFFELTKHYSKPEFTFHLYLERAEKALSPR